MHGVITVPLTYLLVNPQIGCEADLEFAMEYSKRRSTLLLRCRLSNSGRRSMSILQEHSYLPNTFFETWIPEETHLQLLSSARQLVVLEKLGMQIVSFPSRLLFILDAASKSALHYGFLLSLKNEIVKNHPKGRANVV